MHQSESHFIQSFKAHHRQVEVICNIIGPEKARRCQIMSQKEGFGSCWFFSVRINGTAALLNHVIK